MSSYSRVEQTLQDILFLIKPNNDDWAVRFHIIQEVRDAVQTVESLRGAAVEPLGSFVSNLFTRWGDLDLSVVILTRSHISNTWRKQKEDFLADVLNALRSRGTWRKLRFISNAKVPFLRLEHNLQRISCDISINNLNGQMKAKLLFWITEIDERFRDMVLLVKEWAEAHDINESNSGSLNSYCLTLLVIFHFQTCVPAILPPLKKLYPGDLAHDLSGVRTDAENQIEETCAVNINRFLRSRGRNESSLSALLISFFEKFSNIDVRASEQGINPYSGKWENIESNMAWLPRTFALYVEDPFEQPANTARTVTSSHLTKMARAFRATRYKLQSNDHNQATLFANLLREDLLQHVTSSSLRNTNKPRNYNRSRPQVNKAVASPSQSHQTRNTRNKERSNNVDTVQPNQNQAQQIWRPKNRS
ncbi:TUTase domain-containing protein [Heracleum sosnowskyi]|uniref:TUTase domain-containing protein n=1 Tax=Heracleum sosnowskyi TaxID=360622 RepID=A0AAD8MQZ7_9APIA|nr:TUTase domain-containing protein [Heracleum sosnowskyi]